MKQHNGLGQRATVKDLTDERKFNIEFISGGEELITYNGIINKHNQKNKEGYRVKCHYRNT